MGKMDWAAGITFYRHGHQRQRPKTSVILTLRRRTCIRHLQYMPKRENRKLHTLEPNRYCPPTFLLVRTYKWLCTNLETVNSRELKLLTSTLLNYASYPKTSNFTPRIKKYYLKLFSTASRTDYGEEHYACLTWHYRIWWTLDGPWK